MSVGAELELWLLCTGVLPLLWLMQGLQGLLGSPSRSVNMAVAIDACGNALLGGDPRMTISERTGLARWQALGEDRRTGHRSLFRKRSLQS